MVLEKLFPDIAVYLQVGRFFLVLAAGILFTRVFLMPLASRLVEKRGGDKVSVHTYSSMTGLVGLFMSFIVALQAAQFGGLVTVLGAITAALTVAVGFGMRDQISNIVGGFFVYTDAPFVKGDYIKVNDKEGVVKEIKLRQTILNGPSSGKLVIPNSVLTLNPVENLTKGRKTKIVEEMAVEPRDAAELEEICLEVMAANEEVLEEPAPEVSYEKLGSEVGISLNCWVQDSKDAKQVESELLSEIMGKAERKDLFKKDS